jgi:hypothetical protein
VRSARSSRSKRAGYSTILTYTAAPENNAATISASCPASMVMSPSLENADECLLARRLIFYCIGSMRCGHSLTMRSAAVPAHAGKAKGAVKRYNFSRVVQCHLNVDYLGGAF